MAYIEYPLYFPQVVIMNKKNNVAIVGATGAVGQEILSLLALRGFEVKNIKLFASEKSLGKTLPFQGQDTPLQTLHKGCFSDIDIAFFSAGSTISKLWVEEAVSDGAIVIDNSSAFRMKMDVPLIIPEINPDALFLHKGLIANPNCSTIIMLMALFPLHKEAKIKRIVAATYQAASGAGASGMEDLIGETKAFLHNESYRRRVIPFPYAFNLFLHNSHMHPSGYNEEELKMAQETKKILADEKIAITATCVRVPVLRTHSEALNVEFENEISAERARELLNNFPGVKVLEDRALQRFAMPLDAVGQHEIFCGRIREDISRKNTLDLWVVGDQLLKGAALNAVQIAELIYAKSLKENSGSQLKLSSSDVIG